MLQPLILVITSALTSATGASPQGGILPDRYDWERIFQTSDIPGIITYRIQRESHMLDPGRHHFATTKIMSLKLCELDPHGCAEVEMVIEETLHESYNDGLCWGWGSSRGSEVWPKAELQGCVPPPPHLRYGMTARLVLTPCGEGAFTIPPHVWWIDQSSKFSRGHTDVEMRSVDFFKPMEFLYLLGVCFPPLACGQDCGDETTSLVYGLRNYPYWGVQFEFFAQSDDLHHGKLAKPVRRIDAVRTWITEYRSNWPVRRDTMTIMWSPGSGCPELVQVMEEHSMLSVARLR